MKNQIRSAILELMPGAQISAIESLGLVFVVPAASVPPAERIRIVDQIRLRMPLSIFVFVRWNEVPL